jgi:cytolysin-activating lysine-acyltransferase
MSASKTEKTAENEELAKLAELAKRQAQAVLKKLPALGPVTWLMMQQGASRHAFVADLEWRVMPALVLEQAKLYMKDNAPIAFVSWARLSAEAAERYRRPPHHLGPADWKSGDQVWLVDLIAPFGGAQEALKDLRENVFPTSKIHQLAPAAEGAVRVIEWPALRTAS